MVSITMHVRKTQEINVKIHSYVIAAQSNITSLVILINPLKNEVSILTQCIPNSKHSTPRLYKTKLLMLYKEKGRFVLRSIRNTQT